MQDNPVSIVDIRIPFWRLVAFFIKVSIAAIPAAIVVALLYGLALLMMSGIIAGLNR